MFMVRNVHIYYDTLRDLTYTFKFESILLSPIFTEQSACLLRQQKEEGTSKVSKGAKFCVPSEKNN